MDGIPWQMPRCPDARGSRASSMTRSRLSGSNVAVPTPQQLEIAAHSLIAVLGLWLGLTVLTRSRALASMVFTFLSLALTAWSSAIIVQRLSSSADVAHTGRSIEELAAALIVPATAHLSLAIATAGHPPAGRRRVIVVLYVLSILFALPGILTPTAIQLSTPNFTFGPVPGPLLGWAWIVYRLATLSIGTIWLLQAHRRTQRSDPRRRQLEVTLATVIVAAIGGAIRFLPIVGESDPWIGVSLVALAVILAAAAVLPAGVFFAADIAGKAFWTSVALGVGLFLLVGVLVAVDTASRKLLGLDLPLLTAMCLVLTIALYEPVARRIRAALGNRSPADLARGRLLRALGQSTLTAQSADAGVQPALARLTQALDLAGAVVVRSDGSIAASTGTVPDLTDPVPTALIAEEELVGELRVGPTRSGRPLTQRDEELVRLSAVYVAAALRTGQREDRQAEALNDLSEDRAQLDSTASTLHVALLQRAAAAPGLHVFALGALRVERGDERIQRWGGQKAGTRQAQGLFAFLFDRGERGVAKDEALELIWPDTDLERADLAFHRTLGGLRHTLDPNGRSGRQLIRFYNDRYRLDPGLVDWSDVSAFLARLDQAGATADRAEALRLLEAARALYRGDYLDDCPFYGDSAHVEDRRQALRGRYVDVLLALGEGYEATGHRASAAAAYRDALAMTDECPPAQAGLRRLAHQA
jgi:DNA-binding SARP family transcriptional activator